MKHVYQTSRDAEEEIVFNDAFGQKHDSTVILVKAARYVFRGGRKAFAEHLRKLNQQHGEGYATEEATA